MEQGESTSDIYEILCTSCGATLTYAPGSNHLKCQYCSAENEIDTAPVAQVDENDYQEFLRSAEHNVASMEEVHTVSCTACGASTTLRPNVTSDMCPFCATPLVVTAEQVTSQIKPAYLLPFSIELPNALRLFELWIAKRWFAPGDLKHYAANRDKIAGLYIPYWTYDSATASNYSGQRGTNHTETYTAVENGKRVTRSRTVIRWRPVHGSVHHFFDDVLVVASTSLPEKYATRLEPWDLENLKEFNGSFLAGFKTETYRVGLEEGFEKAKGIMDGTIRELITRDIGGDHQRITSVATSYSGVTFKHILLPVWLSAYRYKGKVFRFMVNGRTGEVQGERPWSVIKISLAVIGALALLGTAWFLLQPYVK